MENLKEHYTLEQVVAACDGRTNDALVLIEFIEEGSFNIKNLAGSILKEMVLQYSEYIEGSKINTLLIVGGIPQKLPILYDLFKKYYPEMDIKIESSKVSTHQGLIRYINKYL
jgi:hypothetical protein